MHKSATLAGNPDKLIDLINEQTVLIKNFRYLGSDLLKPNNQTRPWWRFSSATEVKVIDVILDRVKIWYVGLHELFDWILHEDKYTSISYLIRIYGPSSGICHSFLPGYRGHLGFIQAIEFNG